MFDRKTLHHAYLIEGDKDLILADINKFLQKEMDVAIKGNPDYWFGQFDNFGIDDSRELVARASLKAPGKKFFIVAFNFITHEAQNSLLKILEEPTAETHFFLITPSSDHLVSTLKSRLVIIKGQRVAEGKGQTEGEKFVKASKPERLKMVKKIIDAIADEEASKAVAITLVNEIEEALYRQFKKAKSPALADDLQKIIELKSNLFDRGSSAKLILEYLAVTIEN